ncbi:hypothetical protein [uncultured Nostoc sp.]|uniref:hypothetical protein n=1 Tax=uncultured Nostoc sp. TaxID=340711 RepID=UPI0035C9B158
MPPSALLRTLLNPINNCWQGNDQNPIFQASQNPGAEYLMGHSLKLAIAFQDRYLDRITMILPIILGT